ncbi:MAG: hypothetical protein K0R50_1337 [Eubacterium sp.]|nr:hypothetical protein [Eubacterium sp.]
MTEEDNSAAFRRFALWLRLMPGCAIIKMFA